MRKPPGYPRRLFSTGRHEPAATIAGFAVSPMTTAAFPESNTAIAHLSDVLGDQRYESLARKGETMTTATMANYGYDQTRAELNAVSKQTTYEALKTLSRNHPECRGLVAECLTAYP